MKETLQFSLWKMVYFHIVPIKGNGISLFLVGWVLFPSPAYFNRSSASWYLRDGGQFSSAPWLLSPVISMSWSLLCRKGFHFLSFVLFLGGGYILSRFITLFHYFLLTYPNYKMSFIIVLFVTLLLVFIIYYLLGLCPILYYQCTFTLFSYFISNFFVMNVFLYKPL